MNAQMPLKVDMNKKNYKSAKKKKPLNLQIAIVSTKNTDPKLKNKSGEYPGKLKKTAKFQSTENSPTDDSPLVTKIKFLEKRNPLKLKTT